MTAGDAPAIRELAGIGGSTTSVYNDKRLHLPAGVLFRLL